MGTRLKKCPKECFLSAFWHFFAQKCQKALKKRFLGHSGAGAHSTPWGTFRPGSLGTPVNGGRDRKIFAQHFDSFSRFHGTFCKTRKCSQTQSFRLESTAGIPPKAYKFKAFEASRAFPEISPPPSTAGDAFFFVQKCFRRGPLRAGQGIPTGGGVYKPGGFPLFSGKVRIVSRTLSGLFLAGANMLICREKRKGQIGKSPEQIRKIPRKKNRESPKKNRTGQKKDKKGRTSPDREAPHIFETPRRSEALDLG